MIILTETTDNLQIVLGGAVTTNQLQCISSWRDLTATTHTPGRTVANTNDTTDVNIVPAPAASTQRVIDFISVYQNDTVNATVTVKLDVNGTEYILWKGLLVTGERLEYTDDKGFQTYNIAGAVKVAQFLGSQSSTANVMTTVVSTADTINNNGTANTLADVTGLSFPVTSGEKYYFEASIKYTAAATSTGSRWTMNGPTFTDLHIRSEYTITSTTATMNTVAAYAQPAACNASSLTDGNVATIWGFVTPSADGTMQVQFASEVLSSAITAQSGSVLKWQRVA